MLVFALIGASLGAKPNNRTSRSQGFGISVVLILVYYVLSFSFSSLGVKGTLPPLLAAWSPVLISLAGGDSTAASQSMTQPCRIGCIFFAALVSDLGFTGLEAFVSEPVLLLGLLAFGLLLTALPWSFWALSNGQSSSGVRSLIALSNLLLTAQLVLRWWQSGHFRSATSMSRSAFLPGPAR